MVDRLGARGGGGLPGRRRLAAFRPRAVDLGQHEVRLDVAGIELERPLGLGDGRRRLVLPRMRAGNLGGDLGGVGVELLRALQGSHGTGRVAGGLESPRHHELVEGLRLRAVGRGGGLPAFAAAGGFGEVAPKLARRPASGGGRQGRCRHDQRDENDASQEHVAILPRD